MSNFYASSLPRTFHIQLHAQRPQITLLRERQVLVLDLRHHRQRRVHLPRARQRQHHLTVRLGRRRHPLQLHLAHRARRRLDPLVPAVHRNQFVVRIRVRLHAVLLRLTLPPIPHSHRPEHLLASRQEARVRVHREVVVHARQIGVVLRLLRVTATALTHCQQLLPHPLALVREVLLQRRHRDVLVVQAVPVVLQVHRAVRNGQREVRRRRLRQRQRRRGLRITQRKLYQRGGK